MSTVARPAVQRLVLDNITWESYRRLLKAFDERPGLRLTYDRGVLEIMTLTYEHESDAALLGRLVVALTEELNLPLASGGSTTFRRRKYRRGLEADECYWILNEHRIRGKRRIDLRVDPPPDLAVEVDVTSSSLDRMSIYGRLGVPEVWRLKDQVLTFHLLDLNRRYTPSTHSLAFPRLASADLAGFLALRTGNDENTVVRQFRAWVRQTLVSPPTP